MNDAIGGGDGKRDRSGTVCHLVEGDTEAAERGIDTGTTLVLVPVRMQHVGQGIEGKHQHQADEAGS